MGCLAPGGLHGKFKGQNGTPQPGGRGSAPLHPHTVSHTSPNIRNRKQGPPVHSHSTRQTHALPPPSLSSMLMFSVPHPYQLSPNLGWKSALLGKVDIVSLHTLRTNLYRPRDLPRMDGVGKRPRVGRVNWLEEEQGGRVLESEATGYQHCQQPQRPF